MHSEHQIPIWFFIGGTLLIYGLIILSTGLYALVDPALDAGVALNWLHAAIWWGALMTIVGLFYCYRFNPWRSKTNGRNIAQLVWLLALGGLSMATADSLWGDGPARAAEPGTVSPTYREVKDYLARHTEVVELTDSDGARVAICPEWQGRVMTSTCGGPSGPSFGFVHREFIDAGKEDLHFNNYGGEDRFWLSPEGGPFSLWFAPGMEQKLDNWFTPPAFNAGAFQLAPGTDASQCRLTRQMKLHNTAGTPLVLTVSRNVRLVDQAELAGKLGAATAKILKEQGVRSVAYETVNTITNDGPPITKEKGLVSIWILSMLNASPKTVIIVPYCSGSKEERGPVVRSDYFGEVPPERLKIMPEAILLAADARYRSKIGVSPKRAKDVLGAIDLQANVLTLAHFTLPEDPAKVDYMNNLWGATRTEPYSGDAVNAYNDGPLAPGKKGLGPFCEIESLSPAAALKTGQSLAHRHCTIHIQADPAVLARIARQVLGVDLEEVRREMAPR
jgi:hypothetical protein